MELSLLDCDNYLAYRPSMIASSALFLATHIVPYNETSLADIEKVCSFYKPIIHGHKLSVQDVD